MLLLHHHWVELIRLLHEVHVGLKLVWESALHLGRHHIGPKCVLGTLAELGISVLLTDFVHVLHDLIQLRDYVERLGRFLLLSRLLDLLLLLGWELLLVLELVRLLHHGILLLEAKVALVHVWLGLLSLERALV